jgi:predicted SAM-dependent methyltransferase
VGVAQLDVRLRAQAVLRTGGQPGAVVVGQAGRAMLQECHRVLKPGGTIRVATPDLAVLLGLYGEQRSPLADRYVRWIVDSFMPEIRIYSASFVINNAFRNWGHKFLYDAELLEMALRAAGFTGIRRCAYGESADANLRAMESHGRTIRNQEMAAFETMVFEADRPLRLQPAT